VALLDEIFTAFDAAAERHGIEKIKTIGDAYMAVAGLPAPMPDHAAAAVELACEMVAVARAVGARHGLSLELRVGIASGPVMAGVIGRTKFSYDAWGETVNLAARLQTTGHPGRVHISAATRQAAPRTLPRLGPPHRPAQRHRRRPDLLHRRGMTILPSPWVGRGRGWGCRRAHRLLYTGENESGLFMPIKPIDLADFDDEPPEPPAARPRHRRARHGRRPAPWLAALNPEQRQAVETLDGPLLVLAGAGTGKTRVLTTRLAHVLASGKAWPSQILVVTFTNKAAREMKDRIGVLIGGAVEGMTWLGTFHSIGVKLLRRHAELVGLKSDFTILDTDDQLRLMKQLLSPKTSTRSAGPPGRSPTSSTAGRTAASRPPRSPPARPTRLPTARAPSSTPPTRPA
jgi:hypothetical protein